MEKDKSKYFIGDGFYDETEYKIIELTDEEVSKIAAHIDLKLGFGFIDKLGVVYKQETDQGLVYKNYNAYKERSEEVPCYISEKGYEYYYKDFLDECGGNTRYADYVFEVVDWQSPEALAANVFSDSNSYPEFFDKSGNILLNK